MNKLSRCCDAPVSTVLLGEAQVAHYVCSKCSRQDPQLWDAPGTSEEHPSSTATFKV